MSKLDDLINKLCPVGVEYKTLGEVAIVTKLAGFEFTKYVKYSETGNIIALRGLNVKNGQLNLDDVKYIDESDFTKLNRSKLFINDMLFTYVGTVGQVALVDMNDKYYLAPNVALIRFEDKKTYPPFMKYVFQSSDFQRNQIDRYSGESSMKNLTMENIRKFKIPVPPLEVQNEIVHVLDKFTSLEAELEAELEARRKQYEYYRDSLLTFGDDVEWKTLKEIAIHSCSGGTPLKNKSDYYTNGTIPWLRTGEVKFNEIYKTEEFITELAVKETSAKWIPENCVIVAISGATAGRCAINKIPLTTNQHCLNIEINPNRALYKYVYYCIVNQQDELLGKKEGARGDLNSSRILGLKIPLPSLSEQERIISILDRFEKLCNDITTGLPAEIKARHKQYEYYRDKLLTFKRKEA